MRFFKIVLIIFSLLAVTVFPAQAASPSDIRLEVKEFQLKNGMQFLVVERPLSPQVACRIAICAGSALEETGKTGIAHMLEHMMFKGTKNFGTLNLKKDQELQKRIEAAYHEILSEEKKRNPNKKIIKAKRAEMDTLRLEVQKIYVPQPFSSQLERNGAIHVNAFTSKDQTQYLTSVPSDMLEQWFSIASEQIFEPSWREFYVEKEVVQREWAFRYINNPDGAAWLDLDSTAYTAHPYRNPTIGWKSDMEKFNTRDAMAFHKKNYNPTNAVCVLVGDVTVDMAKKWAKIYFERYPAGKRSPEEVTREPAQNGPRKRIRFLKGARTPTVRIGFHAARMRTRDFYALDALTMVLDGGLSARLTQNIVNKGRAVSAWAANPDNRYAGMMILGGSPNEPDELKNDDISQTQRQMAYVKACEDLEKILLVEIEKLKNEQVSDRELKRIKKLNRRNFLDTLRENERLAGTLATLEVQTGWDYIMTYLDEMEKVTAEEIMHVARKYIRPENKTSVYVVPGGEPDKPLEHYDEIRSAGPMAAAMVVKPKKMKNNSMYPTPKGWKHPLSFERKPKKISYPEAETAKVHGATFFYLPDRELPLIDLRLLIRAGSVDIADAKTGLTYLLNNTIIEGGTKRYPPLELARILDENAVRISVSVNEEDTVVTLSVIKDDWERGLGLLADILQNPRFDPQVLHVAKEQILTGLRRQGGDARQVSAREFEIWHFKGHPYGRDPLQGLKTIPAISKADLRDFVGKYVVPSNMVVGVTGDIEKEKVIKDLARFFETFPKTRVPDINISEPNETPPVLAFINKPGQVQSQVILGLPGIKRTDPDYWKMNLLMDIMGGSGSMMYTRLRANLGLVYAAWFYQTYKWKAGILIGYIGCRGDKTRQAIHETVRLMEGLRKDVPEDRLEQKRLDALNSFVFNVDTPSELVAVYGNYYMRKEPLDTLDRIQDAFMNANRDELIGLANKLLDSRKLQIFIVGDKTTSVKREDGSQVSLEEDLKALAEELGLPYTEIPLR